MRKLFFVVAVPGLFILCTLMVSAAGLQILHGHVPRAVTDYQLTAIGRLPADATLQLAIGLPLRNKVDFDNFLIDLYTPGNPNFRKYLTPAQFTEKYGPTEQDYQALIEFARTNGLTVTATHPNRKLLDISTSVADIERVFHITMRTYQHPTEARTFFAPDVEPSAGSTIIFCRITSKPIKLPLPLCPTARGMIKVALARAVTLARRTSETPMLPA